MKKVYLMFVFLWFINSLQAQRTIPVKLITINLHEATITQFINVLEDQSGYHFYADTTQLDSLRITLQAKDQPLERILGIAFDNSKYHYTIVEGEQRVFLTRTKQINTQIAP
ncbi:MAG: hypothetical protein ABI203_04000, partial [Mucilaginibacter sp.]